MTKTQQADWSRRTNGLPYSRDSRNVPLREYVGLKTYAEIDQFASSRAWECDPAVIREGRADTR